jgi:hypothetical protein
MPISSKIEGTEEGRVQDSEAKEIRPWEALGTRPSFIEFKLRK